MSAQEQPDQDQDQDQERKPSKFVEDDASAFVFHPPSEEGVRGSEEGVR